MKLSDLGPFAAPVFVLLIYVLGLMQGAVFGFVWRPVYDDWFRRWCDRIWKRIV